MGLPLYPDLSIPTWKEFCDDYKPHFFNSSGEGKGRNYIIIANGDEEVGAIRYEALDKKKGSVALDIWMRAIKYCGSVLVAMLSIPFVIIYIKYMVSPILS